MEENGSSNSDFNEIPSWYEAVAAAPPPPPNGPSSNDRRRRSRSPIASQAYANTSAPANHAPNTGYYVPADQSASNFGGTAGRSAKGFGAGLIARLGMGAIFLGGGWFLTMGTTAAESLEVGDCFVIDDAMEIERVETPGCNEPHDTEVVGLVTIPGPSTYPSDTDPYWEQVYRACDDKAMDNIVNIENVPNDAVLDFLIPLEAGWNQGDRDSICIIWSPTNIDGSLTGIKD